jgi:uncharacterized protein YjiS (DUF1127 family)
MTAQLQMRTGVIKRNRGREQIRKVFGRATVADALRPDLLRLARLVRRYILEPYGRWRGRGIAIAQLRSLDDRLLADIGLTRGQIELAVDGMLSSPSKSCPRPVGRGAAAEAARDELPLAA